MRAADDALARLIAPVEAGDFWRTHHGRRPLLGRDAARAFGHLLSTPAIEALLAAGRLRHGECRLVGAGEKVPRAQVAAGWLPRGAEADDAVVDPLRVAKVFAQGNTLVLDALHRHHAPIAALCRDLEGVFGHAVQANAYLTPAGGRGFDPHYDTHDVFVLQIEGRKRWRVYDDPVPAPAAASGRRPDLATTAPRHLEAELAPGDVLYLPRGWFHDAEAADAPSLHLTVGLLATTWADALRVALDEAVERDPRLRAALPPRFPWWAPAEVDAAWSAALDALRATLRPRAAHARLRRRFLTRRRPLATPHLHPPAPPELDTPLRAVPGLLAYVEPRPDAVVLHVGPERLRFPPFVEPDLRAACSGQTFSAATLPGELDDAGRLVLVRRLVKEGVVERAGDEK